MHEYFYEVWNTIYMVLSDPNMLEAYSTALSNILMGVIAIIGIGYLKPLKEKTLTATFNFWSQLRVRLLTIKKWLEQDCGLLDNMYSPDSKKSITILTPEMTRISEFKKFIEKTICFIENSDDQMPAYIGWSKDYTKLITYLEDMILYDICDHDHFFKFNTPITESEREEYRDDICNTIVNICNGIETKQQRIEKRICKKSL